MEKTMTAIEAYHHYNKNGMRAAAAMGIAKTTFYSRLKKEMSGLKKVHEIKSGGGLKELRQRFGKSEIENRRITIQKERLEKFVSTILKKNQWMKDADVREFLGIPMVDFTKLRNESMDYILEARDENSKKVLLWVHPDYMDEARAIIIGSNYE